ncbi:aspartic peptidase domain-containing protein [Mycena galopus ATCC 62051]|nr:aspartic peptidase domain-containing protein [Mycena galopus ATCC 62051]
MLFHPVHLVLRVGATLCIVLYAPLCAAEPLDVPLSWSNRRPLDVAGTRVRHDPTENPGVSSRNTFRRQFFGEDTSPFYFANISIGTPYNFRMMVDTTTSTTMVSGKVCSGCSAVSTPYDATASSTAVNKSTTLSNFPYGDGGIEGYIFADTLKVGPFTVPKAEFLQINDMTDDNIPTGVSGILGLAFAETVETTATPFRKALTAANASSNPELGFWLSRVLESDNVQEEEETAGVFTFGGVNSSLYSGNIDFVDLAAGGTQLGFWMLEISAIARSLDAIYGPEADVQAIYAAIPGSSESVETVFQFPCNTTMEISVSFGGQTWSISPQDMNQGPVSGGSSDCFGAVGGITGAQSPSWRFGIPFLRNVYSVFRQDPASIGFAELSTGGHRSSSSISATSPTSSSAVLTAGRSKLNTGAVAGGVIAGIAAIIVAVAGFILYRRRRNRRAHSANHTVSAFQNDVEALAPTSSPSAVMAESAPFSSSTTLFSMKRAQAAAVGNYRLASNNFVQTPEGLQLSSGTASAFGSDGPGSNHTPSPSVSPVLPPGAQAAAAPGSAGSDPAILQELQTLRNEVRWLVNEHIDPPPTYT